MKLNMEEAIARWIGLGYAMESAVEYPRTVSRRGGIVDVYPPDSDLPARIEFSGDEVETIRLFDPASQRSVGVVSHVSIIPAREIVSSPDELDNVLRSLDLSALSISAREAIEEDVERLAQGQWTDGFDLYASLVNDGAVCDYLPGHSVIMLDQPDVIEAALKELDFHAAEMRRAQVQRGELPCDFPVPYLSWSEIMDKLGRFDRRLTLEQWAVDDECCDLGFGAAPSYSGRVSAFLEEAKGMVGGKRSVVVVSHQSTRLSELLEEQDVIASPVTGVEQLPSPGSLTLVQGSLGEGWTLDGQHGVQVLTDAELFGYVKERRAVTRRPVRHEEFLSELSSGDYVVHIDHGIGRFSGLTRKDVDGGGREYLILEYSAGDRLYVPTEQIDRVNRYIGPGGHSPSLSRLGTQEWSRAKRRVREAAGELAKGLLALYSARQFVDGLAISADTVWQQELEASFPYVETQDQLRAVQEVKGDMERPRPMDRLVCGDVGYGKTEVALRAAFKAIMSGMQVAVLVPTTVLAQQHFVTFSERLGAFPVRVELLSRFRSAGERQEVVEGLANGTVDICIGTHRLLQKDVSFKDLGLVIIDEEQRFGVGHKERLKQLRKEVDVLTLSATPIPRTLHMAMVGVRDMSTMETPPEERLPIKTLVSPYNERLVREAILREIDRNGQVFYVHNRVQRIGWVARKLESLVPEASFCVGHGQMPEEALESVMLDFSQGKVDVLVCTTIIESGLDLPNVNTLIVDDADRLGLTQLYQLRGRVGRGTNRAYAYFLYGKGKQLTDTAQKRLRTIQEATELGSGFRIAMKDLEIRGAGNLLGPEQSGPMGAVGFDLYCRLLSEAVSELKAVGERRPTPEPAAPTVDLPLSAFVPEEYVPDLSTRLALYMKLASVGNLDQVADFESELEDRFGSLPAEVRDLLFIVRVKLMAMRAGVREVSTERGQVVVKLGAGAEVDKASLQRGFGDSLKVGTTQLRLDLRRAGKGWRNLLEKVLMMTAGSTGSS